MSSVQHLRDFIRERLTAAAAEIFTEVEKTIICYEEELDAQRRMMGINWKPEIKLNRIGSELRRQSSDLQNPRVSVKEEAATVQQACGQERRSSHDEDEAECQWTEEERVEPEPPLTEEHWEPGSLWIKEEEEEAQSPVFNFEQQEPEPLPTRQNQKQFAALMETFTLQRRDLSEGPRTEHPSFHISAEAESKEQEGSSSTVSEGQSHTDSRKGPVSCGVCGRLLKNKYDLKQHYMTHTGEKPFTCETCSKSFARRSQLNVHYRTHTGERPFTCPICKKSFFQIGHLNAHKNIHTGVRPFSCETCGKSFTRRYLLNMHRRSHTGERPFSWESFVKSF
ncbi:oocyte zinc finger protein XlCOF8.4-like isoform X1 [Poecilia formosa]|uniref:Oocyte zinc finger protein XlCOF8.4-like n=1 Tax=Poecilia formosa TaxID=48698 RepID=A0A096LT54_POEFO|nr:PREDICTED: oocyte zinc finger protein XlCOF8.4-like isoform X1 [Poecilia formosa]